MGKILYDTGSHVKSSLRGAAIGLAAAGCAMEWWIIEDWKALHDGKVYDYFALIFSVFFITCVVQGAFFILTTFSILPKGLKFVLEIIGDFVCSALCIIAAIITASNCETGLGKPCMIRTVRPPIWICLATGILNGLVLILTGLKK